MKHLIILLTLACSSLCNGQIERQEFPVILSRSDIFNPNSNLTVYPYQILGYKYDQSGNSWIQIPIQIDERKWTDGAKVYGEDVSEECLQLANAPCDYGRIKCSGGSAVDTAGKCNFYNTFEFIAYADGALPIGADEDASFDALDELVFMSKDAGDQAPLNSAPSAISLAFPKRIEIRLSEVTPNNTTNNGYVYLFVQIGNTINNDAGSNYVDYQYLPVNNNYNYDTGGNPENSTITGSNYQVTYKDRWIREDVQIMNNVDILDRLAYKKKFVAGCARTEDTGSNTSGTMITNKNGPVRAIRSMMGANSGRLVQENIFFYEEMETSNFFFRVHPSGINNTSCLQEDSPLKGKPLFFDFNESAFGMQYINNGIYDDNGALIDTLVIGDGKERAHANSFEEEPKWSANFGAPGTMIVTWDLVTDISDLDLRFFYKDDTDNNGQLFACTGENAKAIGANGVVFRKECDGLPNTDPRYAHQCCFGTDVKHIELYRNTFYKAPDHNHQTVKNDAEELRFETENPLSTIIYIQNISM